MASGVLINDHASILFYLLSQVEDDVTNCQTVLEKKCKEVTVGYTTKDECDEWPVEKCSVEKKLVKKVTPEIGCHKEPVELCAPKGCGFSNVSLLAESHKDLHIEILRDLCFVTTE